MKRIRTAVIGVGSMGASHLESIRVLPDFEPVAVCDLDPARLAVAPELPGYADYRELLACEKPDAVIVATPHWAHPEIAVAAINQGCHVLVEKPIAVHKTDGRRLVEAAQAHPELKVAAMFNQRLLAPHRQIKALIDGGELGPILRINWIITDWFRSQYYYDSGDWRASWRGEGGGALLNQCPHQLDLMQHFFGLPSKVTAHLSFGKYHDIEVEDDVTAFLEYPDGSTGVFITSTGEAPGTNRLEIAADRGRLVLERGELEFIRNEVPVSEHSRSSRERFLKPPHERRLIPCDGDAQYMHRRMIENFGRAILGGEALVAPAAEGLRGLELGNAMLLSGLEHRTVTLPLDEALLLRRFDRLIAGSTYTKPAAAPVDPARENHALSWSM